MTCRKAFPGVEIKLPDGKSIKGSANRAIYLSGEGRTARDWKGELGLPAEVWKQYRDLLRVGETYQADLYALGQTTREEIRLLDLPPADTEGDWVEVDCCGPDWR